MNAPKQRQRLLAPQSTRRAMVLALACASCCSYSTTTSGLQGNALVARSHPRCNVASRFRAPACCTMAASGWAEKQQSCSGKNSGQSRHSTSARWWGASAAAGSNFASDVDTAIGGGSGNGNGTNTFNFGGDGDSGEGDDDSSENLELVPATDSQQRPNQRNAGAEGPGTSSSSSSSRSSNPLKQTWHHYLWLLASFPLITKALTAGFIAFVGDFAAQRFEHDHLTKGSSNSDSDSNSNSNSSSSSEAQRLRFSYNRLRSMAVIVDGVFITGPGLHVLYNLLESHIPTTAGGILPAALHVLLDTFLFDPVFVATFFCTTAALEGKVRVVCALFCTHVSYIAASQLLQRLLLRMLLAY
jgi:hypothetical protein